MNDFAFTSETARDFASRGCAVLGIRDSGKTYTATLLAERLMDAGIPIIAFDPIGVWRFLRTPGAGHGYKVVVVGGKHGDLPLTKEGVRGTVRAAMKAGVSLVIDLFDVGLSKGDWRLIVTECMQVLLHENAQYGLRHIFLEEAAEFIPQKPQDWITYAEVEKVARMGGNSGLGLTIINQRSEEVAKAVLELCDNLFLHRQKGRNSLTSLSKWLDVANVINPNEIINSLSTLPTGECWAWLNGADRPFRIKVPEKNSLHPDRRALQNGGGVPRAPVDVSAFVEKLLAANAASLPPEAKASQKAAKSTVDVDALQKEAHADGRRQGDAEGYARGRADGIDIGWTMAAKTTRTALDAVFERRPSQWADNPYGLPATIIEPDSVPTRPQPAKPAVAGTEKLGAERRILAVLAASHPAGMTEAQWAVASGMKRSGGTWSTYKSRLRTADAIVLKANLWHTTPAGRALIGAKIEKMPPPGKPRVEYWAAKIPTSGPMLRILASLYPNWISRDQLARTVSLSPSGGTFSTYLSRLSSAGLIEKKGDTVRAAPELME